ncbi:MAG: hypothetical protein AAGF76_10280 [Pseudomonadota bacterium]
MTVKRTGHSHAAPLSDVFQAIGACDPTERRSRRSGTSTVSLRLTVEERVQLERSAAGLSLSSFIRSRLFGEAASPRKVNGRVPIKDHAALARVLRALGRSDLLPRLEALNWATENGALALDRETSVALRTACVDVAAMRRDLITALGLRGR